MKRALYFGLSLHNKIPKHHCTPSRFTEKPSSYPTCHRCSKTFIHRPLIKTVPRPLQTDEIQKALAKFSDYTHLIFTSQTTVDIFANYNMQEKQLIAVGKATADKIINLGWPTPSIALKETSEGILDLLSSILLKEAFIFWPHSALSLPIISTFLKKEKIPFEEVAVYDTHSIKLNPLPNLDDYDELIFTSPSTVDAFLKNYSRIPKEINLTTVGPITEAYLHTNKIGEIL